MEPAKYNLLIDLNGTCHIGDNPTPGAIEALQKLRAAQQRNKGRLNLRFCSNTSKESSRSLLSRLRRVGFGSDLATAHDVFTSLDAAINFVSRRRLRPLLLLSSSAQSSFKEQDDLAQACFFASPELDPASLSSEQKSRLRSCNAVVIGLCPELMTQAWLDEAFRLLSREYGAADEVVLIATHRGTCTSSCSHVRLAHPFNTDRLRDLDVHLQHCITVQVKAHLCRWDLVPLWRRLKLHVIVMPAPQQCAGNRAKHS